MIWALELLRLVKRHISGRSNVEHSEEIKPVAIATIELRLSEGISHSQSVSQSAEKSVKYEIFKIP